MRNNRVVLKRKTFIISAVFILILVLIILAFLLPKTSYVRFGTLAGSISGNAVIVRSESVFDASKYDKLVYVASDGQLLQPNGQILSAYERGSEENLNNLANMENSIVSYQNRNIIKDYERPELNQIDFDINVIIEEMKNKNSGKSNLQLSSELKQLIANRQSYIRANFVADSTLQKFYSDENQILSSLNDSVKNLAAPEAAYVSYYCDDMENEYTFEKLLSLKAGDINSTIKAYKNPSIKSTAKRSYKLINPEKWYIVLPLKNKPSNITLGAEYPLYINNSIAPLTAKLVNVKDDSQDLYIFELSTGMADYITQRVVSVNVGESYTGYMVPAQYLQGKDKNQLLVNIDGKKKKFDVQVVHAGNQWAVIAAQGTDAIGINNKIYSK